MTEEIRKANLTEPSLDEVVGGNSNQNNPLHSAASEAMTELSVDELKQVAGGLTVKTTDTEFLKVKSANSE
jgi:hypothetical protein